jgi:hypothetical protein
LAANPPEPPYERALGLLKTFLDETQRADLELRKGFRCAKGERFFWIPLEGPPTCAFLSMGLLYRYCIHTTDESIPQPDQALTFLTWIQTSPEKFHRWANVIRTTPLPAFESEDDLCDFMARGRDFGRGESPYTTFRGAPPATEKQRHLGLRKAKDLKEELRIHLLKDRLALVDIGSQAAVTKLAQRWPTKI